MPVDPYVYPGTATLRNVFGIRDHSRLAEIEFEASAGRMLELLARPEPGSYDLDHLARLHRRIFGDVYPWAGEIRTVAIAKEELFALPAHIPAYATGLFVRLAEERHLAGLQRAVFCERVAFYFAEINALHPFRDGNGRTQRAFLKQLGREAGWDLEWRRVTANENVAVSVQAMHRDLAGVNAMFDRITRAWPA